MVPLNGMLKGQTHWKVFFGLYEYLLSLDQRIEFILSNIFMIAMSFISNVA